MATVVGSYMGRRAPEVMPRQVLLDWAGSWAASRKGNEKYFLQPGLRVNVTPAEQRPARSPKPSWPNLGYETKSLQFLDQAGSHGRTGQLGCKRPGGNSS